MNARQSYMLMKTIIDMMPDSSRDKQQILAAYNTLKERYNSNHNFKAGMNLLIAELMVGAQERDKPTEKADVSIQELMKQLKELE